MDNTNQPKLMPIPFAQSGIKRTIPNESQISVDPGAASFTDGFPPLTFENPANGGVPPKGVDFNGILNQLSDSARWTQAGGMYTFNAEFAASIGGYPKGAVLNSVTLDKQWLNTIENNTSDPDVGGTGWENIDFSDATLTALRNNYVGAADLISPARTGIFFTPDEFDVSYRFGKLAYVKNSRGEVKLLTDLSRFKPSESKTPMVEGGYFFFNFVDGGMLTPHESIPDLYIKNYSNWQGDINPLANAVNGATGQQWVNTDVAGELMVAGTVRLSAATVGGNAQIRLKMAPGQVPDAAIVISLSRCIPTPGFVFVDPVNGNDSASGTNWRNAVKTCIQARTRSPRKVWLKSSVYLQGSHFGNVSDLPDVCFESVGGKSVFAASTGMPSSWTSYGDGVYYGTTGSDTATGCISLDHVDPFGRPSALIKRSSIPEVTANAGSFYSDGTTCYISLPGFAVPVTGRVIPIRANNMRYSVPDGKFQCKGITFLGTFSGRDGNANTCITMTDCDAIGSISSNGFDVRSVGMFMTEGCYAASNTNDGFNYTPLNGVTPHFLESQNLSWNNLAEGTSNGTTSHFDSNGARFDCHTIGNRGPGIADIDDTINFIAGCTSRNNGPNANAAGVSINGVGGVAGKAIAWIDGGSFDGNSGPDVWSRGGATVYYRDVFAETANSSDGTLVQF